MVVIISIYIYLFDDNGTLITRPSAPNSVSAYTITVEKTPCPAMRHFTLRFVRPQLHLPI